MMDIFDLIEQPPKANNQDTENLESEKAKEPKKRRTRQKKEEEQKEDTIINNTNADETIEIQETEEINNPEQQDNQSEDEKDISNDDNVIQTNQKVEPNNQKTINANEEIPLTFLENPMNGHLMVGRKKSIFAKYGEEAALYLGKTNEQGFSEKEIYFDSLDPQVMFVCGARGSGKSYVLGVVAEELALKNPNVGMVVIDPVGVFWSMKYPNRDDREVKLLREYNLDPKGLDNVFVFIPEGAKGKAPKETYDSTFTLQPSFLTAEDWSITFGFERFSPPGLLLEKVLKKVEEGYRTVDGLLFKGRGRNYDINDITYALENDSEINSKERGFKKDSVRALVSRFEAAKTWGIFSKTGTPLIEISVPGQLTIIDVSFLEENVAALLVGILARRILGARKINTRQHAASKVSDDNNTNKDNLEYDIPPTWLFLDEAHTLIPGGGIVTPASKALIEYVKQGRQPGCSLVFATQQPSAIDTRVLSQVGTLITYKLIFDDDIKAVFKRMPTQVPREFKNPGYIKGLEIGIPLIADRVETTSRVFKAKIRPRMSQHEGRETQTAEIKQKNSKEDILKIMTSVAIGKLQIYDQLDIHGIETLLKILNMKYKADVSFDSFSNALVEAGVQIEADKYFVQKEDDDEQLRSERIVYKGIIQEYDYEQMTGILNRKYEGEEIAIKKVFRPIFKVHYKAYNKDGSFVSDICFIDPVKVEFIHFIDKSFMYSQGLNILRLFDADDIQILLTLPLKSGFDIDFLKDNTGFGEVKLKRVLDRLIQVGVLRKEKRGIKNVYFTLKNIELPRKPLHKTLGSLSELPVEDIEVEKDDILDTTITLESLRNLLGTLWGNIKIDEIETILRAEYMVTNLNNKETAMYEGYLGKQI